MTCGYHFRSCGCRAACDARRSVSRRFPCVRDLVREVARLRSTVDSLREDLGGKRNTQRGSQSCGSGAEIGLVVYGAETQRTRELLDVHEVAGIGGVQHRSSPRYVEDTSDKLGDWSLQQNQRLVLPVCPLFQPCRASLDARTKPAFPPAARFTAFELQMCDKGGGSVSEQNSQDKAMGDDLHCQKTVYAPTIDVLSVLSGANNFLGDAVVEVGDVPDPAVKADIGDFVKSRRCITGARTSSVSFAIDDSDDEGSRDSAHEGGDDLEFSYDGLEFSRLSAFEGSLRALEAVVTSFDATEGLQTPVEAEKAKPGSPGERSFDAPLGQLQLVLDQLSGSRGSASIEAPLLPADMSSHATLEHSVALLRLRQVLGVIGHSSTAVGPVDDLQELPRGLARPRGIISREVLPLNKSSDEASNVRRPAETHDTPPDPLPNGSPCDTPCRPNCFFGSQQSSSEASSAQIKAIPRSGAASFGLRGSGRTMKAGIFSMESLGTTPWFSSSIG